MTEAQYKAEIERLEKETKRLEAEKRSLLKLAFEIREFCPRGDGERRSHEWTVVRAVDCAVFCGGSVRSADFECDCGATMSISDEPCLSG